MIQQKLFIDIKYEVKNTATIDRDLNYKINKARWTVYLDENGSQMVLTAEKNGKIRQCYIPGDQYMTEIVLQRIRDYNFIMLDRKQMRHLMNYCTYGKWTITSTADGQETQPLGIMDAIVIYPGTKWCGAGNISEGYDDLGSEVETDKCCREHDHCDESIEAFGSKYGLDNNSPFTKSHCMCDEAFYDCLREANTKSSNRVGKIFFNYIRMECFKLDYPATCSKYKGYFRPRCIEYELDEEQNPIWQFFDAKVYVPATEEEDEKLSSNERGVFQFMLPSTSLNSNRTDDVEEEDAISSELVNIALQDILASATKQPARLKQLVFHKAKK